MRRAGVTNQYEGPEEEAKKGWSEEGGRIELGRAEEGLQQVSCLLGEGRGGTELVKIRVITCE